MNLWRQLYLSRIDLESAHECLWKNDVRRVLERTQAALIEVVNILKKRPKTPSYKRASSIGSTFHLSVTYGKYTGKGCNDKRGSNHRSPLPKDLHLVGTVDGDRGLHSTARDSTGIGHEANES